MNCLTKQDLCIQQGTSKTLCVTVLDDAGDPVDLTGGSLYLTVRQNIGDVSPSILKTSADPLEIEILPQVSPTIGQAKIYLIPGDTVGLATTDPYVYDIWVELADGTTYPVIAPSTFLIIPSVTNIGSPGSPPAISAPRTSADYIYQPGGGGTGPVVFEDWKQLEAAKEINRGLSGDDFICTIRIDDSVVSPAVIPANGGDPAYNFTSCCLEGNNATSSNRLDFADGCSIIGLRRIDRNLGVRSLTTGTLEDVGGCPGGSFIVDIGFNCFLNQANGGRFFDMSNCNPGDFALIILRQLSAINFAFGAGSGTDDVLYLPSGMLGKIVAVEGSFLPVNGYGGAVGSSMFFAATTMAALPNAISPSFLGSVFLPSGVDFPPSWTPTPLFAAPATSTISPTPHGAWYRYNVSGGPVVHTLRKITTTNFKNQGIPVIVAEESGTAGLTVAPPSGMTLNGGASPVAVPPGGAVWFVNDGLTSWRAVSFYDPNVFPRVMDSVLVTATPDSLASQRLARYDTTAGNIVANLPSASSVPIGRAITVKNEAGANNVNVTPAGADTIDGIAAALALTPGLNAEFVSDGVSNWTALS